MAKQRAITQVKVISHKDEVITQTDLAVEKALFTVGLQAEKYAKGFAPVDTGRLRNSINFATHNFAGSGGGGSKPHGNPNKGLVCIGTNVEYAPYQEFGTKYQSGTKFLRPAIENHISEYKSIMDEIMSDMMK